MVSPGVFLAEHDVQRSEYLIPVAVTNSPFFADVDACQIEHFHKRLVIGETALGFCDLTKLPVQSLDDIGCIYDFPNFGGIFKEGR